MQPALGSAAPLSLSLSLLRLRTGVESMGSPDHGRPRSPCSRPRLPSVPALDAGVCSSLVPAPLAIAPVHQRGFNRAKSPSALALGLFPLARRPRPSASPPRPRRVPNIVKEQSQEPVGLSPRPLPLGHEESPASQRKRAESPSASALGLFPLARRPSPLPLGHEESPASQRNRAKSPLALALGLFPSALDLFPRLPSVTQPPCRLIPIL